MLQAVQCGKQGFWVFACFDQNGKGHIAAVLPFCVQQLTLLDAKACMGVADHGGKGQQAAADEKGGEKQKKSQQNFLA